MALAVVIVMGGVLFKFPELFYTVSRPAVVKVKSLWERLIEKSVRHPQQPVSKDRKVASLPVVTEDLEKDNLKHFLIETHPSGAEVFVDQKRQQGFTPVTITVPTHKAIRLMVKKKGYQSVSRTIMAEQIHVRKLKVSLKRIYKSGD